MIATDISELQKNQATTVAKIAQYKRKLMDLSHRVLQVHTFTFTFTFNITVQVFRTDGMPSDK